MNTSESGFEVGEESGGGVIEWAEIMKTDISSQVKCKHCWALLSKMMAEICSPFTVITENIFFFLKSLTSNVLFPYHPSWSFFPLLLTCWRIKMSKFMQGRCLSLFLRPLFACSVRCIPRCLSTTQFQAEDPWFLSIYSIPKTIWGSAQENNSINNFSSLGDPVYCQKVQLK